MAEKHYKLRILPLFEDDLNEICAEAFEPYSSAKERRYPYYRIPVKNYTIFYVVIGDTMEIRRIIYSRRDLDKQI